MADYRFHLEKYKHGNRYTCPSCNRNRCFTRYVDELGEVVFPDHVGRCDHEQSCGYHYTPSDWFRDNPCECTGRRDYMPLPSKTLNKRDTSYIDGRVMSASFQQYEINPLFKFLVKTFGQAETQRLFSLYNVGTSKKWGGAAVFWQVDVQGRVRTGKIMRYDAASGHRIKVPHSYVTWVHSELGLSDYNLRQCFFGERLLYTFPEKTVAIVESEKTAIIASHFMPEYVWIATGGKNGCFNTEAVQVLKGRSVILVPDLGAMDNWRSKLPILNAICKRVTMSRVIEDMATDEQREQGLDIADFLLMEETPEMRLERMVRKNPCLQTLIDTLGLVIVKE